MVTADSNPGMKLVALLDDFSGSDVAFAPEFVGVIVTISFESKGFRSVFSFFTTITKYPLRNNLIQF